jgi:quercetin dioxygenase-like cupin family protein
MSVAINLGPVAYRLFTLARTCDENVGHTHHFDHITVVQAGGVILFKKKPGKTAEKESGPYKPGDFFLVLAGEEHRLKATQPNTRYACLFTHRDFDDAVVQEYGPNCNLNAYDLKQPEAISV